MWIFETQIIILTNSWIHVRATTTLIRTGFSDRYFVFPITSNDRASRDTGQDVQTCIGVPIFSKGVSTFRRTYAYDASSDDAGQRVQRLSI